MRVSVYVLVVVLLCGCQGGISNRDSVGVADLAGKSDTCAGQTSPSPQCPSGGDEENNNEENNNEENNNDKDERCDKECDEICDDWGVYDYSDYEGDVNTCTDDSYTVTRTGTRSRTCPDVTCNGTKKECLTTEETTETKEKDCQCPTISGGEVCQVVGRVCVKHAVCNPRDDDRCDRFQKTPKCIEWKLHKVCKPTSNATQKPQCSDL